MRVYELTVILNPNLDKEAVNSELDKLTDMVKKAEGTLFEVQHLGMRKLTFEIAGFNQGNFYTIYFNAVPGVLTEMDKFMKLNENFLRSMTIVLKQSIYEASRKRKSDEDKPSMAMHKRTASVYSNSDQRNSAKREVLKTDSDSSGDDKNQNEGDVSADDNTDNDREKEA